MSKMQPHRIVILGCSYAGMGVAHRLLKALPSLSAKTQKSYQLTIVSDNTHFWWTIGAPRAMTQKFPSSISDSFIPIAEGFKQYSSDVFRHIHARVLNVDTQRQVVDFQSMAREKEAKDGVEHTSYDILIVATGAKGEAALFSYQDGHQKTEAAYHDLQSRLPTASEIVLVGGGPAGVETAAELGDLYGSSSAKPKSITLYTGSDRPLALLSSKHGENATSRLEAKGVKVVNRLRLVDTHAADGGRTTVSFNDGSSKTVDILLQATGRAPNAGFMPKSMLNDQGAVRVDSKMRSLDVRHVYAVGDVASSSDGGMMHIYFAVPVAATNVLAELESAKSKEKDFNPSQKETQLVSIGKKSGLGSILGWKVPAWVVWLLKSRTMMFSMAKKHVMGTAV